MAKLELPIRSFLEPFARRAFPDYDWSRGSGINDLVMKPFAVFMQPLRHEIDVVKINQSIDNYLYMRESDLDGLAANWGKFRQRGARAIGDVRIYFDTAADYNFTYLEFYDDAGSLYTLVAPVTITAQELLGNRRADGTFFADVTVQSVGIGDRYVVPAGSIRSLRNKPQNIVAVENILDFQVTQPNETNLDVVNSMFRNVGMRNLVARTSIRAPLLERFPGILDIFIAGADNPRMARDLVTVTIDGQPVDLHLGAATDVWVNTASIAQRQLQLSYLPSTGRISVVSLEQAREGELAFSFTRGVLTAEGLFVSPDHADEILDESAAVVFDVAGLSVQAPVAAPPQDQRHPLLLREILGGTDLLPLPARGQSQGVESILLADVFGINLARVPLEPNDILSFGADNRRAIRAVSGRVMEVGAEGETEETYVYDGPVLSPGAREIEIPGIAADANINDKLVINEGPAPGEYSVLATDVGPDRVWVGRRAAAVFASQFDTPSAGVQRWLLRGAQLTPDVVITAGTTIVEVVPASISSNIELAPGALASAQVGDRLDISGTVPGIDGSHIITALAGDIATVSGVLPAYTGPGTSNVDVVRPATYAEVEVPTTVDSNHWLYEGTDAGYDQGGNWYQIQDIERDIGSILVTINTLTTLVGDVPMQVIGGLSGSLQPDTTLHLVREKDSHFPPVLVQNEFTTYTLYANNLSEAFPEGDTNLEQIGIGGLAEAGDLVVFDYSGVPSAEIAGTGGDGSRVTALISKVISFDEVELVTPFGFDIPAETQFAVVRARRKAVDATVNSVNAGAKTVEFTSFPLGVGDATGMGTKIRKVLVAAQPANLTVADGISVVDYTGVPTLADVARSDWLEIAGSGAGNDGVFRIIAVDDVNKTVSIEGGIAPETANPITATIHRDHINQIVSSSGGLVRELRFQPPATVFRLTMDSVGYVNATQAAIGKPVVQDDTGGSGNIYNGILYSYDNTTRIWEVIPNNPAVDVFTTGVPCTITGESATGSPTLVDTNGGAGYPVGYVEPAPADLGKFVRQGTNTGILDQYDNVRYIWWVKPLGDSDTFQSTTALTYVDNGNDPVLDTDPQGTLLEPASAPVANTGSSVVTLANTPEMVAPDTIEILNRFGFHGGFANGPFFEIYDAANPTDFLTQGVSTSHRLFILNGINAGDYEISSVEAHRLKIVGSLAEELVAPANSPGPQKLTIPGGGLPQGTTIISETNIGLWGGPGRVLVIKGAGFEFRSPIQANPSINQIELQVGLPTTLYDTVSYTWEVLEGFISQYLIVDPDDLDEYRTYAVPRVGDVVQEGVNGSYNAALNPSQFRDTDEDFSALLGAVDFESGDFELFITSGPDASSEGIPIAGIVNSETLDLSPFVFENTEINVQYYIRRLPTVQAKEGWYRGVITGADTVRLEVPDNTDLTRYNTLHQAVVLVEPHPNGAPEPAWECAQLTGVWDPSTKIITLDDDAGHGSSVGIWTDGAGFDAGRIGDYVRVSLRVHDRLTVQSAAGSVINTYNYYINDDFFVLPIVRIQRVEQLDPETLEPIRTLTPTLVVGDEGLRYSHLETNEISIAETDARFQPLRVTYIADTSIEAIHDYLNAEDTRVLSANQMAKRMETISCSVQMDVRTEATAQRVANVIANYINKLKSTQRLTKAELLQHLFTEGVISYVDLSTVRIDANYYEYDGTVTPFTDVDEVFGADTALYLSNVISVVKIEQ